MSWLQPLAWVGLLAIALPVLIHLLGLGRARRLPFPTLRFLQSTRLLPSRRTQLHDPWLLLVRAAIVLFAVAAMAQPLWQTGARRARYAESLARVVVLDTSRSVRGAAQRSGWSADSARALAAALLNEADVGVLVETARPDDAVAGAIEWLRVQAQRQELVVVSDFQRGAVHESRWDAIPAEIGIRLLRIGSESVGVRDTSVAAAYGQTVDGSVSVSASFGGDAEQWNTRATWSRSDVRGSPAAMLNATRVTLLSGADENEYGSTLVEAARSLSTGFGDSAVPPASDSADAPMTAVREVVVVSPRHEARVTLGANTAPLEAAWMLDVLARVATNELLSELTAGAEPVDSTSSDSTVASTAAASRLAITRNDEGRVIVYASAQSGDGVERLLLFPNVALENRVTAALLVAAQQAVDATRNTGQNDAEFEVHVLPDSSLAQWQREAAPSERSVPSNKGSALEGASDARWLWLVVLLLLVVETVVRRRTSIAKTTLPTALAGDAVSQPVNSREVSRA